MLGIAPQQIVFAFGDSLCSLIIRIFDCSAGIGAMVKKDFDHFGGLPNLPRASQEVRFDSQFC